MQVGQHPRRLLTADGLQEFATRVALSFFFALIMDLQFGQHAFVFSTAHRDNGLWAVDAPALVGNGMPSWTWRGLWAMDAPPRVEH